MEPEARYTLVGAAVLALIAMLVTAFVWLSYAGSSEYHFYTIHFVQQSLSGLQLGSDVNMRGVKVGRVESYQISPEDINRVDVTIRVSTDTPVRENTTAVVSRNLVTGLARIDLITSAKPGPELTAVLRGEIYPVIPEGASGLDQIADALGRVASTGESALANLDRLLSADNRETLIATVAAVGDLVRGVESRLDRFDQIADSVQQTAVAFKGTARALEESGRRASDAMARATAQIDPLSKQARTALADLSSAARSLERQSSSVVKRLETATDASGIELRLTARELRGSAESLARAAERVSNPAGAILGPSNAQLGPGEQRQ